MSETNLADNEDFCKIISVLSLKKIKQHPEDGLECDLCLKSKVLVEFTEDGGGVDAVMDFTSDANETFLKDFIKNNNLAQFVFDNGYDFRKSIDKVTAHDVLDEVVSTLFNLRQRKNALNKFHKLCDYSIAFGENLKLYRSIHYQGCKPLSTVPLSKLQKDFDRTVKELTSGQMILNPKEQIIALGIKTTSSLCEFNPK